MTWNHFPYFALVAVLLWAVGAYAAWKDKKTLTLSSTTAGLLVFFGYIVAMWVSLERPPLRTMGETRLWYSLFLPFAGLVVYLVGATSGYSLSARSWPRCSSLSTW